MNSKTDRTLKKLVHLVNSKFKYPTVCNLYEDLLSDESSDIEDFSRALSIDPITTATVIKIANSPIYSMEGQISELSRAIWIVGTKQIADILYLDMTKRMSNSFSLSEEKLRHYWRKSLMIAFLSKELGKSLKTEGRETLFVNGLLSLIGEIPVVYLIKGKWSSRLKTNMLPWDLRIKQHGFAYNELSVELLKSWNFPHKNIIPIQHAHHTQPVKFNKNVQIVQAAFMLVLPYAFSDTFEFSEIIKDEKVSSLGIKTHELKYIYSQCIDLTEQMLSLIMTKPIITSRSVNG